MYVDGVSGAATWTRLPTERWTYIYLETTSSLLGMTVTLMGCTRFG